MIGPDAGCIIASQSQPFKVKGKGRLDFIWASDWSIPDQKPFSLVDTLKIPHSYLSFDEASEHPANYLFDN